MKYLLILPGVLVLLVLIAVVRTLVSPQKTSNYQPPQTDEAEALRLAGKLSKMIQVDTTSHAGGDDPARFRAFHKTLAELFPRVFSQLEKTEIDGNLLFYWKGRSREKPILLMSHQDVVPAEGAWSHALFSGDIADGKVWGRGTADTKASLMAFFQAVEELLPVSTADLQTFYASAAQNKQGITLRYRDVTEQAPQRLMHGTVYLQSKNRGCDVYFFEPKLSFGSDGQALSALRLVLKLTTETDGEQLLFFRLDDLGGGGAEEQATVTGDNVVVSSIDAGGQPGYTADPAEDIGAYLAQADGEEDTTPRAGEQALCALQADEVASVEYWLYLEGCDTACVNAVQTRELSLQLGFAGVSAETTAE